MRFYLFPSVVFWVGLIFTIVSTAILLGALVLAVAGGSYETYLIPVLVMLALGAAFFIPGSIMFTVAVRGAARRLRIVQNGVRVNGTIVSIRDGSTTVTTQHHETRYQFVEYGWIGMDGQRHTARSSEAHPDTFNQFRGSEQIAVFMDAEHPAQAEIDLYGLREPGR